MGVTLSARDEDASLVRAARHGDAGAARAIVVRYAPLVRRCLAASFDHTEIDDPVQDVFERCFTHLGRLRDPSALRSYLIGIALRLSAMERRRRRLRWWERTTESGEVPETPANDDPIEVRRVAVRTREMLERLRPESSRVLELRFVQEQELADVARAMGVSLATAKRHLSRATARIRALARGEPALAEYVRDACAK